MIIVVAILVLSILLVMTQVCLPQCLLRLCIWHCLSFIPWILSFSTGERLDSYSKSVVNHISVISCCCSIRAIPATASYAKIFITFYAASSRQSSQQSISNPIQRTLEELHVNPFLSTRVNLSFSVYLRQSFYTRCSFASYCRLSQCGPHLRFHHLWVSVADLEL